MRISLVLSAAFITAHVVFADDPNAEFKELAGSWQLVRGWSDGKSMAEILDSKRIEVEEFRIEIDGTKLAMHGGAPGPFTYTINLRPELTPKGIDLTSTATPGRQFVEHTAKGIYTLDGDELQLCLPAGFANERPTKFDFAAGSGLLLLELKRK